MQSQYLLPDNSVIFYGCVGKDQYAETLMDANKQAGLAVRYRYDDEQPTGRCGVIITGHNRSMCTDLAAANCYKIEHLNENWGIAEKAKAYFVGGYHLTVCVPAAMKLAEEAAKKNKVSRCYRIAFRVKTVELMIPPAFHLLTVRSVHPPVLQGAARPDCPVLGLRCRQRDRGYGLC